MKLRNMVVVVSAALIGAAAPGFALADHDRQDSDREFSRRDRADNAGTRERNRDRNRSRFDRGIDNCLGVPGCRNYETYGPIFPPVYGPGSATPYAAPFPPGYGPYGKLTPLQSDGY
jgi:hypothetical protein